MKFLEEFGRKWNVWLRQKRNYDSWMSWWIDFAKPKIRSFFRWKTNQAFREFHAGNEYLYGQLRSAYDEMYQNPVGRAQVNKIKAQMLQLQNRFSKVFERLNDKLVCGEKLSSFQLGDRLQRKSKSTIQTLEYQGQTLVDPAEIENHVFDYFKNLYSAGSTRNHNEFPSNRTIPVGSEVNEQLMEEITTTEIFFAVRASASKKVTWLRWTPGGVLPESFRYHSPPTKPDFE